MKKLSLLIALCMLISIGGVYAAWTYTESAADAVDQTLTHGMAQPITSGSAGLIEILDNSISISVDQAAADYTAKLVVTGQIELKFTRKDGAPSNITDSLNAQVVLRNTALDAAKYRDTNGNLVPLYKVVNDGIINVTWTSTIENVYTATIQAADVAAVLQLGSTFRAPTLVAWNDMHAAEQEIGIDIYIKNIEAPTT